jgi:hypothetical protein
MDERFMYCATYWMEKGFKKNTEKTLTLQGFYEASEERFKQYKRLFKWAVDDRTFTRYAEAEPWRRV